MTINDLFFSMMTSTLNCSSKVNVYNLDLSLHNHTDISGCWEALCDVSYFQTGLFHLCINTLQCRKPNTVSSGQFLPPLSNITHQRKYNLLLHSNTNMLYVTQEIISLSCLFFFFFVPCIAEILKSD